MKRILTISALSFILSACGGGGSDETSSAKTSQTPSNDTSSTQTQTQSETQPQSNKLIDNKATDNAQFSQFKSQNMEIDISGLGFEANTVYLKIYTFDNKTLFLGKVPNSPNFEFYLPNDVSKVKYDVFSTVKTDPQITKEYEL
ncbi:hypothetical protein AAEU28_19210 [Pseudoalteromonas sp. SS15]|uniref:hypothetical protein n=1 Tax=Pseudoalteromonas sp. SS15 TaxID=3139393 RepID=UPI003BA9B22B